MNTRKEMNKEKKRLATARAEVREAMENILTIQGACKHTWSFSGQENAFHNNLWDVTWKCSHCDSNRVDKKIPPVCSTCHNELHRVRDSDHEAHAERQKPEHQGHYNKPEAWRCSSCQKIHILHVKGD